MELDRKELGRRIAKRRKEKKIRQYKLAGDIGVDPTHLSSIEPVGLRLALKFW